MTVEELSRVFYSRSRFSIRAVSGDSTSFRGHGTVKISKPDSRTVIFEEHGVWRSHQELKHAFHNVYRWTFYSETERFGLAHLRYGWDRAVHLVDFVAVAVDAWHSATPHNCGADVYSARMHYSGCELKLSWRIQGPTKRQQLDYIYFE